MSKFRVIPPGQDPLDAPHRAGIGGGNGLSPTMVLMIAGGALLIGSRLFSNSNTVEAAPLAELEPTATASATLAPDEPTHTPPTITATSVEYSPAAMAQYTPTLNIFSVRLSSAATEQAPTLHANQTLLALTATASAATSTPVIIEVTRQVTQLYRVTAPPLVITQIVQIVATVRVPYYVLITATPSPTPSPTASPTGTPPTSTASPPTGTPPTPTASPTGTPPTPTPSPTLIPPTP